MGQGRKTTETGWSIRWDEDRAKTAYGNGLWQRETLSDALEKLAQEEPDRLLLVDGEKRISALELFTKADALARTFRHRFAKGSVISFMLPNWYEAAILYLAANRAGMVAHPILPSLRDHDLRFMLADAKSRMIFVPQQFRGFDFAAMLGRVSAEMENPPELVVVRGEVECARAFEELLAQSTNAALDPVDSDDVSMVMYTSGTTGRPKGVLHTHNSFRALITQIGQHWLVERGDRFLVPSPVSHIGGSIYAFEMPIWLGTTAVLMEQWSAEAAIPIMLEERISHMAGATPFLQDLLDAARVAGTDLPDLKLFICGGASVPPNLVEEARGHFAKAIVSRVYGSTEVPVTTVGAIAVEAGHAAAHSDGRPGIAEVILAADGEIRAKGAQMFAGYLHPQDEDAAFDEAGFYRTGDQGEFTDDGYLVVTGRIKDLIIRNGENIAPKEIEDLLVNHPAIAEIAIVGVPNAKTGEQAVAVIVVQDGAEPDGQPDVAGLANFLSQFGVAKFKYPERVEIWDALPKNDAGKVLKNIIRERLV